MTKLGWPAGERGRRLAWLGGAVAAVIALAVTLAVVFWPSSDQGQPTAARTSDRATAPASVASPASSPAAAWPVAGPPADLSTPLPGMPPVSDPANIYADAGPTCSARRYAGCPTGSTCRTAADPPSPSSTRPPTGSSAATRPGSNPQHVVPGYDMRTLYVTNDLANSLTPINPQTGRPAGPNIRGGRPVQHVLHARRALRHRGGRSPAEPGLPRPAHLRARTPDPRRLRGRGPHRLRGHRRVPDRHVRVRRPPGPRRPAHAGAWPAT